MYTSCAPPKNRRPRGNIVHLNTSSYSRPIIGPIVRFGPWQEEARFEKRDASSRSFTSGSRRENAGTRLSVPRPTRESCRRRLELGQIFIHTALSLSLSFSLSIRCCFTTRPYYISQPVFNGYRVIKLLPQAQLIQVFLTRYSNLI